MNTISNTMEFSNEKKYEGIGNASFKHFADSFIEQEKLLKVGYKIPDFEPARLYELIVYIIRCGFLEMPSKSAFIDMAANYFYLTNDFSYLKKCLFYDEYDIEDVKKMIIELVENHYPTLLREKISTDIYQFTDFVEDHNTSIGLRGIIEDVWKDANEEFEKMEEFLNDDSDPLFISNEKFEVLVQEVLSYIDPSDNLLEEYTKCKKEGRIEIKPFCEKSVSSFNYCDNDNEDYEIVLYKDGSIEDVIDLVHEFAHLHYTMLDFDKKDNMGIFEEYPAIYYELKAAEYLLLKGYPTKEVVYSQISRLVDNLEKEEYIYPSLESIYENINKDKECYDLSGFEITFDDEILENWVKEEYPHASKKEIELLMKGNKINFKLGMLLPLGDHFWDMVPYIIGTFFAKDAIEYYDNEEVLERLTKIQLEEHDLYDVLEMHDFDPEAMGMTKKEGKETNQKVYRI